MLTIFHRYREVRDKRFFSVTRPPFPRFSAWIFLLSFSISQRSFARNVRRLLMRSTISSGQPINFFAPRCTDQGNVNATADFEKTTASSFRHLPFYCAL